MESNSKYKYQIEHLKQNYKHFHVDIKKDIFEVFQKICILKNTTPTTEIKKFIDDFIKNNNNY